MNYLIAFCTFCSFFTVIQASNKTEECTETDCSKGQITPSNYTDRQCKIYVYEQNEKIKAATAEGKVLDKPCEEKMSFVAPIVMDPNEDAPQTSDNCDNLNWDIALVDIALIFFLPL